MSAEILAKLVSMEGKLDRLDERLGGIERIQDKQQASLDEHMRRTNLLEQSVQAQDQRIRPLEVSETRWALAAKIVAGLGTLLGAAGLGFKFLG